MTLDELLSDTEFSEAVYNYDSNKLANTTSLTRVCFYQQYVFDSSMTKRLITISKHKGNEHTIYDYTSLTQNEINNLIDAKIKYDFHVIHYSTFLEFYSKIISENNEHIKKYNLSKLTPDLLHEIIHKNEVFIANLNSLYASNKILTELDAL